MSLDQIYAWIKDRENMDCKRDYIDRSNYTHHIVRFENGDTYQSIERYKDIFHKTTETIINNKTVLLRNMVFKNFGWKEATL